MYSTRNRMSIYSPKEAQQEPPTKGWAGWPDHVPRLQPLSRVLGFPFLPLQVLEGILFVYSVILFLYKFHHRPRRHVSF